MLLLFLVRFFDAHFGKYTIRFFSFNFISSTAVDLKCWNFKLLVTLVLEFHRSCILLIQISQRARSCWCAASCYCEATLPQEPVRNFCYLTLQNELKTLINSESFIWFIVILLETTLVVIYQVNGLLQSWNFCKLMSASQC